jgi:hypothetical protein
VASPNRIRIAVSVKPGSKQPGFALDGESIVLRIRERPIEGAANDACVRALAEHLHIAPSSITLERGTRSREKLFAIDGLTIDEIKTRLTKIQ